MSGWEPQLFVSRLGAGDLGDDVSRETCALWVLRPRVVRGAPSRTGRGNDVSDERRTTRLASGRVPSKHHALGWAGCFTSSWCGATELFHVKRVRSARRGALRCTWCPVTHWARQRCDRGAERRALACDQVSGLKPTGGWVPHVVAARCDFDVSRETARVTSMRWDPITGRRRSPGPRAGRRSVSRDGEDRVRDPPGSSTGSEDMEGEGLPEPLYVGFRRCSADGARCRAAPRERLRSSGRGDK